MKILQDAHRLQAFVTVVQEGSLSAAAIKLSLTQPALSTRIKLLEETLGCSLLDRNSKGATPTSIGHTVYTIACEILDRMNNLQLSVEKILSCNEGHVFIGADVSSMSSVIPELVKKLKGLVLNLKYRVVEDDYVKLVMGVKDGIYDLAVISLDNFGVSVSDELFKDVIIHKEFLEPMSIVCSKEHELFEYSKSLKNNDLKLLPIHLQHQNFILPPEQFGNRELLLSELRRKGIRVNECITAKSISGILNAIENNLGIGFIPQKFISTNSAFAALEIEGLCFDRKTLVVSGARNELTPIVVKLLSIIN